MMQVPHLPLLQQVRARQPPLLPAQQLALPLKMLRLIAEAEPFLAVLFQQPG